MRYLVLWLVLWGSVAHAAVSDAEVRRISAELRCMVCEGQSLADSQAGAAVAMRDEVRRQLESGRTEEEILRYFVDRYGPSVRWKPPFDGSTALLWLGPLLSAMLGGILLFVTLGRQKNP